MDGEEPQIDGEVNNHENKLNEKKKSWGKLFRPDSFSIEAGQTPTNTGRPSLMSWRTTMSLAFQSLGVVYGDIGTSPLYVYASTFTKGIKDEDDVIGVLSLIIYTITLVALLKYVFIVLQANDNGEGGTFALYSLICRYAKMGLIPNQEPEDRELSNYALELPTTQLRRAHMIKEKLENSKFAKIILFLVTIMGTSMVIGDGILTPSISVLSAVSGIKSLGQDTVVGVSVAILIILFAFQRFGTDKVGFSFAPIILLWFAVLTGIGLFNLFKHDITVLKALNPLYIIYYFRRTGRDGWISLGGVFLCITGTEAMFADLGHFSVRAVQISFSCVAYPALVTIYCGQAAYLTKHTSNVSNTFYNSIPDPIYWPTFVLAVAASIIASQAMISGAFSIISQSLRMGCFPRVKVVHTSAKYEGQVYIPEINYLLMLACIAVTLAFRTTEKIGHAYGIAVVTVMVITTFMVTLIMLFIWKTNIVWIALFLIVFGSIEMLYLSSVMYKFTSGGYLPLAITVVLMAMMAIWQYVHVLKYRYELREKISPENAINLATSPDINRVPGIGLFYTELVHGITPLFSHYISNLSSVHSVFVLISIKTLPVNRVTSSERFFFRYVGPKDSGMFRCVVRYGYKEDIEEPDEFERQFAHSLKEFIHHEHFMSRGGDVDETDKEEEPNAESTLVPSSNYVPSSGRIGSAHSSLSDKIRSGRVVHVQSVEDQTELLEKAREKGIVYLMGETEITAEKESSLFKKFIVNHAYNFLKKNCREGDKALAIPRSKLLKFHGGGLKASADGVGIRMNTMWRETRSVLIVPVFKYLVAMCLVISLLIFMESVYMNLVVLYVKLFNRKPEKVYKWEAMQGDMELGHQNYPMALVQIPMYNEREVFELSIGAACRLVWPSDSLIIQVLDDSTDPAIMEMVSMECAKWASKDINIKYERRDNRNGYKAGALKHGMRHSYVKLCDYLAIFDADFQPEPDYLQRAIPFLIHNPELALVQARWKFVNVNTCLMTRIQEMSLNYHFMAEQQSGSTIHDFFGFNRTAGVWRIRAMEEAGGWKDRTTVEDMDLAVRVGLLGWKFVFINDLEVKSELPSQFKAFRFQQHRWSCGPANLFRKMMMEIIHNKRVKIWKKFYVIYSFFFLRKIIVHFFTFFFYCVVLPTSVFLPEVAIPTWSTIYGPSIITLFGIIATPRSFYLVVFWVLFENVMAMHRTKGTLIGLFDGGRANEWVVTEKLGGTLKTKLLVRNGQILKRVNLKEMMMGIHILCCACYDFAFGNTYLYLYLFMQATAFLISGVGFVGT